jgi:hypothetical protein
VEDLWPSDEIVLLVQVAKSPHPQGHVTEAEAHRRLGGWDA